MQAKESLHPTKHIIKPKRGHKLNLRG